MIKKISIILIILVVLGGSAGTSFYFYKQYEKIKNNPNMIAQQEIKTIISEVSKLMILPTDEEPSIATVVDKEKLKDQPFFKNSDKGDKILIYTKAQKAILYRPSSRKIIEFAPLALGEDNTTVLGADTKTDNTDTKTTPAKIVLLNGSTKSGLTNNAETMIKEVANVEVLYKSNAAKNDYTSNYVIDLKGNNNELAKKIAQTIGGEVRGMIDGETKPTNADILIIVSK